jgi:hypothetical protein
MPLSAACTPARPAQPAKENITASINPVVNTNVTAKESCLLFI